MRVRGTDDVPKQHERGIGEVVFLEDGIEGYVLPIVTQLATVDVERSRAELQRLGRDLARGREDEFSLRVHELFDEPRASHAVHLHSFASNPFHRLGYLTGW